MKPINEKERTLAFIQFMVLSLLAVVLIMFVVFFNFDLKRKENQVLKDNNKKLKESQLFVNSISNKIDSVINIIKTMDKMPMTEYEIQRDKLLYDLKDWKTGIKDTSNLDRMKLSMYNSIYNWIWDKKMVIDYNQRLAEIKELKAENKTLTSDRDDWKLKYESALRSK